MLHRDGCVRRLPPLRAPPAGAEQVPRTARPCRSRVTARAPSGSSMSCAMRSAAMHFRSSGSTPTRRRSTRRALTLQRFAAAPAGVLVGTQMVAKGHDFPDVSLGVVLDADQTLRFPDFRAEERTFALVTQLAGRTGRGASGGRVFVQTLAPEARPIGFATRHDSDGFVADELVRRRALGYPPYATLIRVVCGAERRGTRQRHRRGDRRRAEIAGRRRAWSRAPVPAPRPGAQPAGDQNH